MKKSLAALLLSALIMSISSPSVAAGSRQTADAVRDIVRHYMFSPPIWPATVKSAGCTLTIS